MLKLPEIANVEQHLHDMDVAFENVRKLTKRVETTRRVIEEDALNQSVEPPAEKILEFIKILVLMETAIQSQRVSMTAVQESIRKAGLEIAAQTKFEGAEMKSLLEELEPSEKFTARVDATRDLRAKLQRSVRLSFVGGATLILASLVGFWLGGVWIGVAFLPGVVGAYGLFLSSGKQLDHLDSPALG